MSFSGNRTSPPVLAGLDLPRPSESSRRILRRLGLGLTRRCNLQCLYCLSDAGGTNGQLLPVAKYETLLREARELGATSIVLVGEGEPLCFPALTDLLALVATLGMTPVLFTNATLMTPGRLATLADSQASVIVKVNSLRPETHDALVGHTGAHAKAMSAITLLLERGFARSKPTRLGIESVILQQNFADIPELWEFCRSRNIFPYFETLKRCGRASNGNGMVVRPDSLRTLFLSLQKWDEINLGIHWTAHPPHVAFACEQHYFSCFVRANGDVSPCSGIPQVVGNVNEGSLSAILQHKTFGQLRNLPQLIEGRCGRCDLKSVCYGCRANALVTTGTLMGEDPDCWVEP